MTEEPRTIRVCGADDPDVWREGAPRRVALKTEDLLRQLLAVPPPDEHDDPEAQPDGSDET